MIAKSRKPFVTVISLVTMLAALGFATQGFAGDKLKVKTNIDTGFKHDSNYFKADVNEEDVTEFFVTPGVDLGYTTGKTDVNFDYKLKAHVFDKEPEGVSDYTEHIGEFGFKSTLTDRITVKFSDSFMYTRDPAQADANSNAVTRNKYFLNRITPAFFYNFNEKLVAGLKYQRTDTDYKDDVDSSKNDNEGGEDSLENKGEFNLNYNLNSTSRVSFDYKVWNRDFDDTSSEFTSNQVRVGYTKAQKYVTFMGNVGVNSREFDQDNMDDMDEFIWNVAILAQNPTQKGEKPRSHGKFSVDQNLNNTGTTYMSTRVSAEAGYIFMDKIDFVLGGYYQNSDYEFSKRDDDTWNGSAKVDYLINDMWVAGIEGGYETRDSNLDGKDYDKDYVMIHVDLVYDFASK